MFGSFAKNAAHFNDIDLLIEEEIDIEKYWELRDFLEEHLDTKIDLVQRRYAEPVILYYALQDIRYAGA